MKVKFNRKMKNNDEELIGKIVSLMERDNSVEAPTDSIKWAKNLFRARIAEPQKSIVRRILAVLQLDLQPNQAVFGERSAASGPNRRILFEAGESAIDLSVTETKKGFFELHGQILGGDFANCAVKLNDFLTETTALSEFKLAKIPRGKYQLTLQSGETEIVIENLEFQ